MARHRIVCTEQEPFSQPTTHAHIVSVGTGSSSGWDRRWTLDEVLAAMKRGDTFYTKGETSGREATVEPFECAKCRRTFIRSRPDAVWDNNLDSLSRCKVS